MLKKFKLEEIKEIEEVEYSGDVFDLEVEDDHTYTINDYQIVHNCSDAAHGLGGHIMADGGCRTTGDIAKSFGAGADFVMLGTMLAGHEESGGQLIEKNGEYFKEVYGMSSDYAMKKHYGDIDKYRSSEGEYNLIKYKGELEETLRDINGGLRSAATYMGAKNIKDIPKCTTFMKVNRIK